MNIILNGLEKPLKCEQEECRIGVPTMIPLENMRHYNIGVNSISGLLLGRFERLMENSDDWVL